MFRKTAAMLTALALGVAPVVLAENTVSVQTTGEAVFVPEEVTLLKTFTASTDARYLDLGDLSVNLNTLIRYLEKFPYLEAVDMFGTSVEAEDVAKLTERFPQVRFGWSIRVGDHRVRTDQTAFSTMHANESVPHSDQDFALLKYCTEMRALDIGHNKVSDLSFLYSMPELRVLIIACNRVDDLTPIASLEHLEYLELFANRVVDLEPLTKLENLVDLNLVNNTITDYTPLYRMPWLQRLWIWNSNNYNTSDRVPMAEVEALQQALPDTHIDYTHEATDGGWRDSPKYPIIYRMFRSKVYEPFTEDEQ